MRQLEHHGGFVTPRFVFMVSLSFITLLCNVALLPIGIGDLVNHQGVQIHVAVLQMDGPIRMTNCGVAIVPQGVFQKQRLCIAHILS
jgi:hypothetical protein